MTDRGEGENGRRVYRQLAGVVVRKIAGETMLVPTRGEIAHLQRIFVLDGVAEYVWLQLDGTRDLETVIADVLDTFDVSPDEARDDVQEFVSILEETGLASCSDTVTGRDERPLPPDDR